MFSNLSQNSILFILDLKSSPKILSGPIENVSLPRPRYNSFNPNMETVVDITATVNGERREFKAVPNGSIANFGDDAFILAENKDVLSSYIGSMLQNSRNILGSMDRHKKLVENYEEALQELNPTAKANDKAIQSLQDTVSGLQDSVQRILALMTKEDSKA